MAGKLKSLTIIPMGPKEAPKEEKSEENDDGLRESFDEYVEAMEAGDHDAAFLALKDFTDMCAMKSMRDEY